jgi:hypothetical protein
MRLFGEFQKVRSPKFLSFLGALTHFVPWCTETSLRQEYVALVTWPSECLHVKAQDSYPPSL